MEKNNIMDNNNVMKNNTDNNSFKKDINNFIKYINNIPIKDEYFLLIIIIKKLKIF